MNMYKVTRNDFHDKGDCYESFICVAETADDAKMLHPEDCWCGKFKKSER